MGQTGKVSVVLPVYNGEQYIEAAADSILGSDYKNLELLIIDDGSTDGSNQICQRLKQRDDRIVVHRKSNGGVVSARNCGVQMASGQYLCFCDQDDTVDRQCYAKQIERMEADRSDICMCSVARSIRGRLTPYELSSDACCAGGDILEQLLYPILFNGFAVPVKMSQRRRYPQIWSCMFRMSFWRRHGLRFRAHVCFEDDLLVKVQALARAERVSTLSFMGYCWRTNLDSESYTHRYIEDIGQKQHRCYEDLYGQIADRIADKEILAWFRKVACCRQYLEAVHNIAQSDIHKSRQIISGYYDDNIYRRSFDECISAAGYVREGMVKPRILLRLLANRQTMPSYYAEKVLDRLSVLSLHSHVLAGVERKMKGIV